MKPVIKVQRYYHLLLMRDDREVMGFRMHRNTLRTLILFFFLFVGTGAAGIAFGVTMWQKNDELLLLCNLNETELTQAKSQLAELSTVRSLMEATNTPSPLAINQEINTASATQSAAQPSSNATRLLATVSTPEENLANATTTNATNATAVAGESGEAAAPPQETTDPRATPLISHDSSPVRINSFQASPTGQSSLRIRYDLVNATSPEITVRGTASYRVILQNGTEHDLVPQQDDDARFAISRMKPVETVARLPQGVNANKVQKVFVTITMDNGSIFHEIYAVSSR